MGKSVKCVCLETTAPQTPYSHNDQLRHAWQLAFVKNANGQVHAFPMFFPFWLSFFSPFILLPFFLFWSFAFWFSICFPFFCIFSNLKIIRISYWGEHKCSTYDWQTFDFKKSAELKRNKSCNSSSASTCFRYLRAQNLRKFFGKGSNQIGTSDVLVWSA